MMSRGNLLIICIFVLIGAIAAILQIPFEISDVKVQQAAIAGSVVAMGWLMTFVFREASELIERNQRGRDLQKALRAEIEDYFVAFDDGDSDATIDNLRARFLQEDQDTIPVFFPLVSEPAIFDKLSRDIHILPESVINNIIRFYSMLTDVRLFAEDMRSDNFKKLSSASQQLAFEDYIEMRAACCLFAYEAMEKIDASLKEVITDPDVISDRLHYAERARALRS